MKKIVSIILSISLIFAVAISTFAAEFEIVSDSDQIKAGEKITVEIILGKTIPLSENIVNLQGELYYDTEILSYVSHEMGEDYSDFLNQNMPNKNRFQFSKTSMTLTPYEVKAGTVLKITFLAAENLSVKELETVFQFETKMMNDSAELFVDNIELNVSIEESKNVSVIEKDETEGKTSVSSEEKGTADDSKKQNENGNVKSDNNSESYSDEHSSDISEEKTENVQNSESEEKIEIVKTGQKEESISLAAIILLAVSAVLMVIAVIIFNKMLKQRKRFK